MCLYSYCVHTVVDLYVFEGHMEESIYNQMGLPHKIKKLLTYLNTTNRFYSIGRKHDCHQCVQTLTNVPLV